MIEAALTDDVAGAVAGRSRTLKQVSGPTPRTRGGLRLTLQRAGVGAGRALYGRPTCRHRSNRENRASAQTVTLAEAGAQAKTDLCQQVLPFEWLAKGAAWTARAS